MVRPVSIHCKKLWEIGGGCFEKKFCGYDHRHCAYGIFDLPCGAGSGDSGGVQGISADAAGHFLFDDSIFADKEHRKAEKRRKAGNEGIGTGKDNCPILSDDCGLSVPDGQDWLYCLDGCVYGGFAALSEAEKQDCAGNAQRGTDAHSVFCIYKFPDRDSSARKLV